jgi:hypothetical protein
MMMLEQNSAKIADVIGNWLDATLNRLGSEPMRPTLRLVSPWVTPFRGCVVFSPLAQE